MPAKKVESFRQKEGGAKIVRILHTKPFVDDKWIKFDREDLKEYLVVKYTKIHDKWLPELSIYNGRSVQWWDISTHNEIKAGVTGYSDVWERRRKDTEKITYARDKFNVDGDQEFFSFE